MKQDWLVMGRGHLLPARKEQEVTLTKCVLVLRDRESTSVLIALWDSKPSIVFCITGDVLAI